MNGPEVTAITPAVLGMRLLQQVSNEEQDADTVESK